RLLVLLRDDDQRRLLAPCLDERSRILRRRLVERIVGKNSERSLVRVGRECGTEGGLALLAVDLVAEARLHGARHPAAAPVGAPRRTGAGPASTFLAPRLRAAAGDESPALDRAGRGPVGAELGAHCLVDEMRLHLGAEDALVERQVLRLLAGAVEYGSLRRRHA